jgi:hypothetical protein
MQENAQQAAQAEQQSAENVAQKAEDLARYKIDEDNATKIEVALIGAEKEEGDGVVEDNSLEVDKFSQSQREHDDKMNLDGKKLSETIRSNKSKESIQISNIIC